jgi:cellulose synthase/poly-beta-1,6-N-acetylglucosamine synthase-like glycosyltransferase
VGTAWVGVQAMFWACLLLLLFSYFLYPAILFVAYSLCQIRRDWKYLISRQDSRTPSPTGQQVPTVSLVIAAHNEENVLAAKIANTRRLDYPTDKLEVIFVSDGSTDRTNQILQDVGDSHIHIALLPKRSGKATAINNGVALARHDILIFSDAATLFAPDAIKKLVRHFCDKSVGVVCGSLQFRATQESRQTEGLYWKYECMLRLMEGRLGATLTASGAIYAIRRVCFQELAPDTILEDLMIPLNARKQGFRIVYDPEALAEDSSALSVTGEFTRRVRLAVGSFRAIGDLIHTPLNGFTLLAFFSHKLLRWIIPFLLIGIVVSSGLLVRLPVYRTALAIQGILCIWAVIGYLFPHRMKRIRFGLIGYFWLAMNLAFLVGFWRFLFGHGDESWQRVN